MLTPDNRQALQDVAEKALAYILEFGDDAMVCAVVQVLLPLQQRLIESINSDGV